MVTAIYPGSFDPITNGHLDIINRASALFDKLIIGIYDRPDKQMLFSLEERLALAREAVAEVHNVHVKSYSGLTVDFIRKERGKIMIRGLRMNSDFEAEFEMAMMNKKLAPDIELICFMTSSEYQCLSSRLIKEVAKLRGCLEGLVPEHVAVALNEKLCGGYLEAPAEKASHRNKISL
jgi:pantetheine-phosphate adenylyltransferase